MTLEEKITLLVEERVVHRRMTGPVHAGNPRGIGVEVVLLQNDGKAFVLRESPDGSLRHQRDVIVILLKDLILEAIDLHECAERLCHQVMES